MSAAILLLLLLVLLLLRLPMAIALGGSALLTIALIGYGSLSSALAGLVDASHRPALLSIPLFVIASALLTSGAMARRSVRFADACVGGLRGGRDLSCVLASLLFATASGSSPATVAAVGAALDEQDRARSAGALCAAGAAALVMPPSIALVAYAAATGTSIADLFLAGIVPAAVLGLMLSIAIRWRARGQPRMPRTTPRAPLARGIESMWGVALVAIVVIALRAGASPLAAAAFAAGYALAVAVLVTRDVSPREAPRLLAEAARAGGMLLLLVAGGLLFAAALGGDEVGQRIGDRMTSAGVPGWAFLVAFEALLVVAAALLEPAAIVAIFAPLAFPAGDALGIGAVHLGIAMASAIGVGLAIPPFGLDVFVASAAAGTRRSDVSRAMRPAIAVLIVFLAIVACVPTF